MKVYGVGRGSEEVWMEAVGECVWSWKGVERWLGTRVRRVEEVGERRVAVASYEGGKGREKCG